jgi:hypothetical protein
VLNIHGTTETECGDGDDDDLDGLTDCDDSDCLAACTPEALCDDGTDEDLDGQTDCDDIDCATDPACMTESACSDGVDGDGDGLTDCDDPECAAECPSAETCADGADNDLDGLTDCDDADCIGDSACRACSTEWYRDWDRDFWGTYDDVVEACSWYAVYDLDSSADWSSLAGDCNDFDASINPVAFERCDDGVDNDCDWMEDEYDAVGSYTGVPTSGIVAYYDIDSDGAGGPYQAWECMTLRSDGTVYAPFAYEDIVLSSDDCDDYDSTSYPGATEICDGADNDCDGSVDDVCI